MSDTPNTIKPYTVLINDEEQYSLWQSELDIPKGWHEQYSGDKDSCLAYIKENWTDLTPKSLRDLHDTGFISRNKNHS